MKFIKFLLLSTVFLFALGAVSLELLVNRIASTLPEISESFWLPDESIKVYDQSQRCLACRSSVSGTIDVERLPRHLINAFLAAEDQHFYEHSGLDYWAIGRAFLANLQAGSVVQGGSTITQQLAKSFMVDRRRILSRKAWEALYALALEKELDKQRLLGLYLQRIEFGQGTRGLAEAAHTYFRKTPYELDVPQAALLAGLPKAPSLYDPVKFPQKATQRRNLVLKMMVRSRFLGSSKATKYAATPVVVVGKKGLLNRQDVVLRDIVLEELKHRTEIPKNLSKGLIINSTIDRNVSRMASQKLSQIRQRLPSYKTYIKDIQAASVIVRLRDAAIVGLVGGITGSASQYDRTQRMRRQPGSFFLPLMYGLALNRGYRWSHSLYALGQQDIRSDLTPNLEQGLRQHLAMESTRLGAFLGLGTLSEFCKTLGLECNKQDIRMAAGMSAETPMGLTRAYVCFARQGSCRDLYSIRQVISGKHLLYQHSETEVRNAGLRPSVIRQWEQKLRSISSESRLTSYAGRDRRGHNIWSVAYDEEHLVLFWMGSERGRHQLLSNHHQPVEHLRQGAVDMCRSLSSERQNMAYPR